MLFWLFVISFCVGLLGYYIGQWLWDNTNFNTEWLQTLGGAIAFVSALGIVISGLVIGMTYIDIDACAAEKHEEYKSLVYQLENDVYNNDNDIGKKELYDAVREWNEDLAYKKVIQNDYWLGIYVPDIYDQFEFIEWEVGEQ